MKVFIAFLGGFGLTLVSFGGGIALAIAYMSADPVSQPGPSVDTAAIWPSVPVKVKKDEGFQRLPDQPAAVVETEEAELVADDASKDTAGNTIDLMTTAALVDAEPAGPEDKRRVTIMDSHVEWCSDRYRSYRAEDNSYQPFSRRSREICVSPFFDGESLGDNASGEALVAEYRPAPAAADGGPVQVTRDHIQSCFDRYRSYRPEDNSYQPYGGGRRQQCQ